MSRLVFLTGPGGAGTTTLAAATAVRAAKAGARVLILGVADAGAIREVLSGSGMPGSLALGRVEPEKASESALGAMAGYLAGPLAAAGFSAPDPSEIGSVPGLPDILALREVAQEASSGEWDLVVVDGPPLRDALNMLAWPETASAVLRRLRPVEGQAARALRPLLAGLVGLPSPFAAVTKWTEDAAAQIAAVRDVLTAPGTVIRLVGSGARTAQPLLKTAETVLALQGLRCDAATLAAVPRQSDEPIGAKALAALAKAAYRSADVVPALADPPEPVLVPDGDGYRYDLPLPGVSRDMLGLVRSGDELVVTIAVAGVASHRRAFVLPAALRRCRITAARLDGGALRVGFKPDETLWPERLLPDNDQEESREEGQTEAGRD